MMYNKMYIYTHKNIDIAFFEKYSSYRLYSTYEMYVENFALYAGQDERETDHVLSDGLSASHDTVVGFPHDQASSMASAVRCVPSISINFILLSCKSLQRKGQESHSLGDVWILQSSTTCGTLR